MLQIITISGLQTHISDYYNEDKPLPNQSTFIQNRSGQYEDIDDIFLQWPVHYIQTFDSYNKFGSFGIPLLLEYENSFTVN